MLSGLLLFKYINNCEYNKIKSILESDIDIDIEIYDISENTLIDYYIIKLGYDYTIIKLLLIRGAKPTVNTLVYAIENRLIELVKLLLDFGVNPNELFTYKYNVINMLIDNSISYNSGYIINLIKLLIQYNLNSNYKNTQTGETLLMYSVKSNLIDMVKLFLEYTDNINTQDNNGYTALMYAVKINNISIVELLLTYNADPNIQNNYGNTSIFFAINNSINIDKNNILKILLKYNADINHRNKSGYTVLDYIKYVKN